MALNRRSNTPGDSSPSSRNFFSNEDLRNVGNNSGNSTPQGNFNKSVGNLNSQTSLQSNLGNSSPAARRLVQSQESLLSTHGEQQPSLRSNNVPNNNGINQNHLGNIDISNRLDCCFHNFNIWHAQMYDWAIKICLQRYRAKASSHRNALLLEKQTIKTIHRQIGPLR